MANTGRADKTKLFPKNILLRLRKEPEFCSLKSEYQHNISRLLASSSYQSFRHSVHEDAFYLHCRDRERLIGSEGFRWLKNNGYLIAGSQYSHTKGITKPYWWTEKAFSLIRSIDADQPTPIIDVNGKLVRTPEKNAIKAKDENGKTRSGFGNISAVVKTDISALRNLQYEIEERRFHLIDSSPEPNMQLLCARLEEYQTSLEKMEFLNRAIDQIYNILFLLNSDYLPRGEIEQLYIEYQSGRLYGASPIHLQNTIREIRVAALNGSFDYDFENAHLNVLYQMSERLGLSLPTIAFYLENKKQVRGDLAKILSAPESKVKQAIIAVAYGARLSCNRHESICQIFSDDLEKVSLFKNNEIVRGIYEDIKKASSVVLENADRGRGKILNAMSKGIDQSEDKSRIIAHLLQGIEAQALNAVIERYGSEIVLLQHDGWTSKTRLDIDEIERVVKERTGFNLKVSEELLGFQSMSKTNGAAQHKSRIKESLNA